MDERDLGIKCAGGGGDEDDDIVCNGSRRCGGGGVRADIVAGGDDEYLSDPFEAPFRCDGAGGGRVRAFSVSDSDELSKSMG